MDPETPLSRTFPTPSDMPFDSPRVALSSMDQHIFPSGASPGLAIRERLERRNHEKHIKRHRPAVLAASSALQNALGIRNTTAWPTPPISNTGSTQSTTERNGFMLREALSECQQYAVRVNRGSELRDFLDDTVHGLSQRKAKVGGPQNTGSHGVDALVGAFKAERPTRTAEGDTILAEPFNDKGSDRLFASYGVPRSGVGSVGPQRSSSVADWQMQDSTNESQSTGLLPPIRGDAFTMAIDQYEPSMGAQHAGQLSDRSKGAVPEFATEELYFPNPLDMPGSFTAAVCGYPNFQVIPLLSLTLKDVVPPMHTPTAQRCILLRHFEIGLDEVEGIVTGEVDIPESLYWTRMREERLGKLGHDKTGDNEWSKELVQKQRQNGWGQGTWLFFGVKLKQSTNAQGEGTTKWFCFGGPVEAIEKRPLTEQHVEIGGGKDGSGREIPTHKELFARHSTLFCLGGKACTDLWDGAEDWDNGVFSEISNAMANVGLLVETLHLETPKPASDNSMRPPKLDHQLSSGPEDLGTTTYSDPLAMAAMDGPAESQKRKSSIVVEYPRKLFDFTQEGPTTGSEAKRYTHWIRALPQEVQLHSHLNNFIDFQSVRTRCEGLDGVCVDLAGILIFESMAYSPSPQPGALGGMSGNLNRLSVTPPPPRVISKQDKRRNLLSERLNAIGSHFARDRDSFYRTQLQSLQLAMNYINKTDLYKNEPLNDNPNDVFEELSAAIADNAQPVAQAGARVNMHEVPAGSDMRVAAFIKEINDAMETRDANLTAIANRYNDAISVMGREANYQVDVASIEHEQLATTVRDRIYQSAIKRRTKLLAERETLDLADTNTVLFYSSNYSSTRQGSPSGPHSNRKTRHTRHRLEVDEMGIIAESNKRKRKGPTDTENGSPTRGVDSDTNHPWKDANGKYETQSSAPPLTLGGPFGLFPHDKDLVSSLQKASRLAIHRMSKQRKVGPILQTKLSKAKTSSKGKARETQMTASSSSSSADEAEPSYLASHLDQAACTNGDHSLEAPAMDRTANSSYHATRSTGVVSIAATTFAEDLALPGDIIGRRAAIDFLGSQREPRKREDDYQRAPPLSEQERDADRQAMKRAMEEMGHGRETKRAKTMMSNAVREVANHIKGAEELIQESCLRETLIGALP